MIVFGMWKNEGKKNMIINNKDAETIAPSPSIKNKRLGWESMRVTKGSRKFVFTALDYYAKINLDKRYGLSSNLSAHYSLIIDIAIMDFLDTSFCKLGFYVNYI
jgi:hypothetical protein